MSRRACSRVSAFSPNSLRRARRSPQHDDTYKTPTTFLGASHTDATPSTVRRCYESGSDLRALRLDDLDALCALYAARPKLFAVCDFTPLNGFAAVLLRSV